MPEITGHTKLLAVIGQPVAHSKSPQLHNHFAASAGQDLVYLAFPVTEDTLGDFVGAARTLGMAGFNVTMPLKEKIVPFLDGIDEEAERFGAVNTVFRRGDSLIGTNTDGAGFWLSLERMGADRPRKAVVLGAGGAAKAVVGTLTAHNVQTVVVSRRGVSLPYKAVSALWHELPALCGDCDLLVNTTPLGMEGADQGDFEDFGFLNSLPETAWVYDLIYTPTQTNLLYEAAARGLRTQNGLLHLACQAALSFEFFTGVPVRRMIPSSFS